MKRTHHRVTGWSRLPVASLGLVGMACAGRTTPPAKAPMQLSHKQTLEWVRDHRAWRQAAKARLIWARPIKRDEIGKPFQNADRAVEQAREGYWLCVGVAGEPWFQQFDKIDAKYDRTGEEQRQFAFD